MLCKLLSRNNYELCEKNHIFGTYSVKKSTPCRYNATSNKSWPNGKAIRIVSPWCCKVPGRWAKRPRIRRCECRLAIGRSDVKGAVIPRWQGDFLTGQSNQLCRIPLHR